MRCVAFAHDKTFVEEENVLLMSATMQLNLRFWTEEFRMALQAKCAVGLAEDIAKVEDLMATCEELLTPGKPGAMDPEPEIATRCLERDFRALSLQLPPIKDISAVHCAEQELHRVLGAVEKYAADLPHVIAEGQKQVGAGLHHSLLKQAMNAQKEYDSTVQDLLKANENEETPGEYHKNAVVKAFLAGAPEEPIEKAWKILEEKHPELEKYARIELELWLL
jgi:hypothetical protein